MKRFIFLLTCMLSFALSTFADVTPVKPSAGDGSEENPYQIGTLAELMWFHNAVLTDADICVDLTNNIDLSPVCSATNGSWDPMCYGSSYEGTFDGKGYTISNLYIHEDGYNRAFFKKVDGCTICNLTLDYVDIEGELVGVAALVAGVDAPSTFSNITVKGSIKAKSHIGGIVSEDRASVFKNCRNYATLTSSYSNTVCAGGIACKNIAEDKDLSCFTSCANYGAINVAGDYAAGIMTSGCAQIDYCMNDADITAGSYCGGLMASVNGDNVTINNCFARGTVSVTNYDAGLLVGTTYQGGAKAPSITAYSTYATGSVKVDGEEQTSNRLIGSIAPTLQLSLTNCSELTTEQVSSGLACYLLQGLLGEDVWGQDLSSETSPKPGSANRVYLNGTLNCNLQYTGTFTNDSGEGHALQSDELEHAFDDGICSVCNTYQIPTSVDDAYQIKNVGHLLWFRDQVNSEREALNAQLTTSLSLANVCSEALGKSWEPIDNLDTWSSGYGGTFDGGGNTISGLYINSENDMCGLFGRLRGGTVRNLNLDVDITSSGDNIGGLVGYVSLDSEISNIVVTGKVNGQNYVGGVIGKYDAYSSPSAFPHHLTNQAAVVGRYYVGGIVGYANKVQMDHLLNQGNVSVQEYYSGGIVGLAYNTVISDCWNKGDIKNTSTNWSNCWLGGIAGDLEEESSLNYCLNTGNLIAVCGAEDMYAGLIAGGYSENGYHLNNCISSSQASIRYEGGYFSSENLCCSSPLAASKTAFSTRLLNAEQIAAGEATYYLQGERDEQVWGQRIETENDPILLMGEMVADRVYINNVQLSCKGEVLSGEPTFSNSPDGTTVKNDHNYDGNNGFCQVCDHAQEAEFNGTTYEIGNAGQLVSFREMVNADCETPQFDAILTSDIDLSDRFNNDKESWVPIGKDQTYTYRGAFDGDGHTISGLYINNSKNSQGLFGCVSGAEFRNLTVKGDLTMSSGALLVGANYDEALTIEDCIARGSIDGYANCAGILGYTRGGTINIARCKNYANISAKRESAGIIADAAHSATVNLTECENMGAITGENYNIGGIAGLLHINNVEITYCVNRGAVTGSYSVGGICGYNYDGNFSHLYNDGTVTAKDYNAWPVVRHDYSNENYHHEANYHNGAKAMTANNVAVDLSVKTDYSNVASAEDLASGLVAFRLGAPFGQDLASETAPRLGGMKVYYGNYLCGATVPEAETICSNSPRFETETPHSLDELMKCTLCHKHGEPATYVQILEDWTSNNKGVANKPSQKYYFINAQGGETLTFDWTVSSEKDYDIFFCTIEDPNHDIVTLVNNASGIDSGSETVNLTQAGTYTLLVRYTKDGSNDRNDDKATVTNVRVTSSTAGSKKPGDVTGNNSITIEDLTMLIEIVAGRDNDPFAAADVDGDGDVDVDDITALINKLINN